MRHALMTRTALGTRCKGWMTDYSLISFDGHGFRPIARAQVQTVVRPVRTW
jgi:hypothetical protein